MERIFDFYIYVYKKQNSENYKHQKEKEKLIIDYRCCITVNFKQNKNSLR